MEWLPFYKVEQALADRRHRWSSLFDAIEDRTISSRARTPPPVTGDLLLDAASDPTPQWWRDWAKANESQRYPRPLDWDFWFQHEIQLVSDDVAAFVEKDRQRAEEDAASKHRIKEGKAAG